MLGQTHFYKRFGDLVNRLVNSSLVCLDEFGGKDGRTPSCHSVPGYWGLGELTGYAQVSTDHFQDLPNRSQMRSTEGWETPIKRSPQGGGEGIGAWPSGHTNQITVESMWLIQGPLGGGLVGGGRSSCVLMISDELCWSLTMRVDQSLCLLTMCVS